MKEETKIENKEELKKETNQEEMHSCPKEHLHEKPHPEPLHKHHHPHPEQEHSHKHPHPKPDPHKERIEELEREKKKLEEANKDLENKLLASKADFINYRKRKDEETSKLLKYAGEDMIKEMLSTVDNFERAISLDDENLEDELSKFLEGFKMIYCNFVNILEKYEIKAIDGSNKPFDPTYHQAVMTAHVEGMEPGMVIEVLQKGYVYKDRVIRPAMVRVSE